MHNKRLVHSNKAKYIKNEKNELIKEYLIQSNFLFVKAYKNKIKITDKITYVAGTCLERKAKPNNIGIKNQ